MMRQSGDKWRMPHWRSRTSAFAFGPCGLSTAAEGRLPESALAVIIPQRVLARQALCDPHSAMRYMLKHIRRSAKRIGARLFRAFGGSLS